MKSDNFSIGVILYLMISGKK